jgi:hypothetical protein
MKTTRQWIGAAIAAVLLGGLMSVGALSAHAQTSKTTTVTKVTKVTQVTKTGWWIRVNPEKTVASTISFQVGMTRADRHDWRTWTAGEPEEFDLPIELRNLPKLYLRGIAEPHRKDAVFCVFFGDHGVQHFKFDGDKDENMKSHDSDHDCKP